MVSKIDIQKKEKVNTVIVGDSIFFLLGYNLKEIEEMTIIFWQNRMYNPTIKMAEA
jgi:hypothetical protein|tara:strand:- start:193 stop:360 length:168 start_codon:yes stop_codon:yes gene_type:complete